MSKIMSAILPMPKAVKPAGAAAPMPDPEDPARKQAIREKMKERGKRGREGTIYSGAYGGSNLGGTA